MQIVMGDFMELQADSKVHIEEQINRILTHLKHTTLY